LSNVPTNLIPTRITGLPDYTGTSTLGYFAYALEGRTYKVQFSQLAAVGAVPSTRVIGTGNGLEGGGDLSQNRVISIIPHGVGYSQLDFTGVTAGTYGSADTVPSLTIDATGRVTAAVNTPIVLSNYVPSSRTVTAGAGLTGGGQLNNNITIALNPSNATPQSLGAASAGTGTQAARDDHVHPAVDLTDTSETQGVLPLGRGGTGVALSPVVGAVIYADNDSLNQTVAGNAGQILKSAGGLGAPYWDDLLAGGTVTSVSVITANGFAGTVANPTSTPAITLTTTVTGLVKANGSALSAAVAGTDYIAPGAITTSGLTMATARLLGRTTASSGAVEEITVGTGLSLSVGSLTNTAPDQVVSLTGGTAISISGTYPSFTITNTAPDQIVSLTGAGTTVVTGTYPSFTITSSDQYGGTVTSVSVVTANGFAGTVANASTTPAITLTTSVSGLVKGNGTALSAAIAGTDYVAPGAYTSSGLTMATARLLGRTTASSGAAEEITVGTGLSLSAGSLTNSAPDQTVVLTAGTGISISSAYPNFTITNSAPDQTVSLTGAGTTVVTGTYPNFTITSNDQYTGTVTSVGLSGGTTGLSVSGTNPITTSGTFTLGGTLVVANGGTGATTLTGYVKGNGTSAFTASATIPASDISSGAALTKTDDTNVTLTLGGSPSTALLAATSLTLGWTGQLGVTRGGTGTGTAFTAGSIVFAGASGVYSQDNANLFWDDSNNRLGIGTTSPSYAVEVAGDLRLAGGGDLRLGSATGTTGTAGDSSIYSDANDMYLNTGNATRVYIANGGNVGIGTVSPGSKLDVVAQDAIRATGFQPFLTLRDSSDSNKGSRIQTASAITIFYNDTTGGGTYTERMRLDASGNLGIGTSSPNYKLEVYGSPAWIRNFAGTPSSPTETQDWPVSAFNIASYGDFTLQTMLAFTLPNDGNYFTGYSVWNFKLDQTASSTTSSGVAGMQFGGPGYLSFMPGTSEKARITSAGYLLVGTTTPMGGNTSSEFKNTGAGSWPLTLNANDRGLLVRNSAAGSGFYAYFEYNGGTNNGSISWSGGTTAYNTTSDYRLKEVEGPITNSGAYIDALNPVQGRWKADGTRFIGLVAHEVQEVSETPVVTGEKDGEMMQQMDYSSPEIIGNMIAELKSLRARVAQLEGK
jgi:hypothetical protein